MLNVRIPSAALACLSLLLGGLARAGSGAAGVPEAELKKLVAQDAKRVQDALAKGALDKKSARRVRTAAFLLAAYAQSDPASVSRRAGLRDAALKVVKALDENKVEEAKAAAAELSNAKGKADGMGRDPVDLRKVAEFDTVMRAYTRERLGGLGMEDYLNTLVELKGELPADEAEAVAAFAHKNVIIAHLARGYPPEEEDGQRTRKTWAALSGEMHAAAQNLAKAAATKKGDAVSAAATKLSDSCTKCHDVFR